MHYDVVVASFRLNAAETPGKVLERVLGVSAEQAKALLRHFPAVVAARVEQGRAEEILASLEAAGAKAELCESIAGSAVAASAPPGRAALHAPPPASMPPAVRSGAPFVTTSVSPGSSVVAVGSLAPVLVPSASGLHAVVSPSTPAGAPESAASVRAPRPSLPTVSMASLPPLEEFGPESGQPSLPPFEESPAEAERPSGQRARPMTTYQLGDLDFGQAPKSPAQTPPPPVRAVPVADLASVPPEADSGHALELASMPPVPAARAAAAAAPPAVASPAAPPAVAKPVAAKPAAKPAPARQGAGSSGTGPSSDGMQTFGDGFDDMEAPAPALELDRETRWRADNTVGLDKAQAPKRTMASANLQMPSRVRRRASFSDGWGESVWELLKFGLGLTTVVVLVLAIAFFIRDPEATSELCGMSPPPRMEALTEKVMANGLRLAEMKPNGRRQALADAEAMGDLTVSTVDAPLHPLLRLSPNVARLFVAEQLRAFVSDVEEVELEGLSVPAGLEMHVDCLLVRHDPGDIRDRDAAMRVAKLLRTGYTIDLPPGGEQSLVNQMARTRGRGGKRGRFTPVCLAL